MPCHFRAASVRQPMQLLAALLLAAVPHVSFSANASAIPGLTTSSSGGMSPIPGIPGTLPGIPGLPGSSSGGGMCLAPVGGNPSNPACGSAPAALPAGGPSTGAGNPINVLTGSKYEEVQELPALPGELGLEWRRSYNSRSSQIGLTGAGWRSSYEAALYDNGRDLQIVQADGRRITFARDPKNPSHCVSLTPGQGRVEIVEGKDGRVDQRNYRWHWPDGRQLSFSAVGESYRNALPTYPLASIRSARGAQLTLIYQGGQLAKVRDPQGRELILHYQGQHLSHLSTPVGELRYQRDPQGRILSARLSPRQAQSQSQTPAQTQSSHSHLYHYEAAHQSGNPWLLTGHSVQRGNEAAERVATWRYDGNGLAIESRYGSEVLSLDYSKGDRTQLTTATGAKSEYERRIIGGEFKLIAASGPGCERCPEANRRYRYDQNGALLATDVVDAKGIAIQSQRIERDAQGRILAQWQRQSGQPERLIARYGYEGTPAGSERPSLIERPSVVPGRMHSLRLHYGPHAQITRIEERGWRPAIPGEQEPQALERITNLTWGKQGGQYLLLSSDGPLPGAADTTRYHYDERGQTIRIDHPAGLYEQMVYDDAGRVVQHTGVRGNTQHLSYDALGAITQIDNGTQSVSLKYDARSRLTGVSGDRTELSARLDHRGRPVEVRDALGNTIVSYHDPMGRFDAWLAQDKEGGLLTGQMNVRGAKGEPLAALLPATSADQNIARKLASPLAGSLPNASNKAPSTQPRSLLAVSARQINGLDSEGAAFNISAIAGGARYTDPAGRTYAVLRDDFGRVIWERSADEGNLSYLYLETGETLKRHAPLDGGKPVEERLRFDAGGRLIERIRNGCSESLVYRGALLRELKGCGNTHTFERDENGRISAHHTTLERQDKPGAWLRFSERYAYDTHGKMTRRTLANGRVMRYQFDAGGNATGVAQERRWLSTIRWFSTAVADQIASSIPLSYGHAEVIDQLRWRPFGLGIASARYANGLGMSFDYDRGGRLAALSTRDGDTLFSKLEFARSQEGGIIARALAGKLGNHIEQFDHDSRGRLVATSMNRTESARLMPIAVSGARQTSTASNPILQYSPHGRRRALTPARDGFGRQQTHIHPETKAAQQLVWDDAHRLREVRSANRTLASYRYDVLGNRIAKTLVDAGGKSTTTYYLYDLQHRLIGEVDSQGRVTRQYLYESGRRAHIAHSLLEGGHTYAIHTDPRGLPMAVTDESKRLVWQQEFDVWGKAKEKPASTQGVAMNLRLAGQYFDAETGLHDNIARSYDPANGRYLSPDPLGWMHGDDAYSYANNDPVNGIDPLGLFKIPITAATNPSIASTYFSDGGHGDILRAAFAQYNAANGLRFSQAIIDQFVANNYDTDALIAGGGQFDFRNHIDNPNDGPMYSGAVDLGSAGASALLTATYKDGAAGEHGGNTDNWIGDTLTRINGFRSQYTSVSGTNISTILNRFGQNSHTLADFYAHSNWLDDESRGGDVKTPWKNNSWNPWEETKYECGWIPPGLNQTRVWEESSDSIKIQYLYTGTVQGAGNANLACGQHALGDIHCEQDETTHGYWAKDTSTELAGAVAYSNEATASFSSLNKFFWVAEKFDSSKPPVSAAKVDVSGKPLPATFGVEYFTDSGLAPKDGDRIYTAKAITNRHEMALHLAVAHTMQEIDLLYKVSTGVKVGAFDLHDVFKMDTAALKAGAIIYDEYIKKVGG